MSKIDGTAAELAQLLADLIENIKLGDTTITELRWFNKLSKSERARFAGEMSDDKIFGDRQTFEITVPNDWNSDGALRELREKSGGDFYYFNPYITDNRFKANALKPGQKVKIHICEMKQPVSSADCLKFIRSQGGFCLCAKDAAKIWQIVKDELPKQKWLIFMNEKDYLWPASGARARVPVLHRYSDGDWDFDLYYFDCDWPPGDCLVFASAA